MNCHKNNTKLQRGFTLIEVIAVLVIIGVVAAVVISRMMSPSSFGLVSETDILKGHLRYAQYRAMSHTEKWGISFSTDSYSLVPPTDTPSNLPNEDSSTHTLSAGITITTGSGTAVYFNEWGNPLNDLGELLTNGEGTKKIVKIIILSDSPITKTVTITENTGFIDIE